MAERLYRVARHLSRGSSGLLQTRFSPPTQHANAVNAASALQMRTMSTTLHPTAGKQRAKLPGFSFPGPRNLDSIVKLQLLQKHGTPRVREIWEEYHKSHKTAVGDALTLKEHNLYMSRTKRCSFFVLPVPRDSGYFTLLLQFQDKHCLCTYLEDFKKNPNAAVPYVTFTLFDELLEKKGVTLVRGEVTNNMTVAEAGRIWELIKMYYMGPRHLFEDVIAFNEKSEDFDFKKVLNVAQVAN